MKQNKKADVAPAECGQHTLTLAFHDAEDLQNFRKYMSKAKAQDGTVGGLWAGIACSAIKRAEVRACNAHDQLVSALQDVMRCFVGERNSSNCAGESGQVANRARAALAQAQKEAL